MFFLFLQLSESLKDEPQRIQRTQSILSKTSVLSVFSVVHHRYAKAGHNHTSWPMKKDIPEYKVEELAIAILPRTDEALIEDEMWDVYLLNLK